MSDDWSDFGAGNWWEEWPPSPDDDDQSDSEQWDAFQTEPPFGGVPPSPQDFSLPDDAFGPNHLPVDFEDAVNYLLDIEEIADPSMIRGMAFETLYEALAWLQTLGLIGFSGVIEQSGAFFPVVGIGYEDPDGQYIEETFADDDDGIPF